MCGYPSYGCDDNYVSRVPCERKLRLSSFFSLLTNAVGEESGIRPCPSPHCVSGEQSQQCKF